MRDKIQRFMMGRYGVDAFSRFLLILALIGMVVSMIVRMPVLDSIAIAILIYTYFRMLSRNIPKRYAENEGYLKIVNRVKRFFNNKKTHVTQFRTHKFFRCPSCHADVRVPRGKGLIRITCPKCRSEFERRT